MSRGASAGSTSVVTSRAALLAAYGDDPMLRYEIPPDAPVRGWVAAHGNQRAVLVSRRTHTGRPSLLGLGNPAAMDTLLTQLSRVVADLADHVSLDGQLLDVVAAYLPLTGGNDWDWMWTSSAPARQPAEGRLLDLERRHAAELTDFLIRHNGRSDARPGEHRGERWVGVRDGSGALLACGARITNHAGWPALEGITTAPAARRQGLGAAVTARLTRDAVHESGVCLLGTYRDDPGPARLYTRLGYRQGHRICSRHLTSR